MAHHRLRRGFALVGAPVPAQAIGVMDRGRTGGHHRDGGKPRQAISKPLLSLAGHISPPATEVGDVLGAFQPIGLTDKPGFPTAISQLNLA